LKHDYQKWIFKATKAEQQAKRFDEEGHNFPINVDLFLKAAEHSRKSAQHQRSASRSANNPVEKALAAANYHIMMANAHKSMGNYFYYSLKPAKAASYFRKAVAQNALADTKIPLDIDNYRNHIQNSIEHILELEALTAICFGDVQKSKEDWTEALKHFRLAKKKWIELRSHNGDYARSQRRIADAAIESTERDARICQTIISLKEGDLIRALQHADHVVLAAEKAFQKQPDWVYYQKALMSAISLKEALKSMQTLIRASSAFCELEAKLQVVMSRNESFLDNLASYKFAREVESYLRRVYQYSNTSCGYSPPYLNREIDVYASKGDQRMTITICECKLRLDSQPIDADEVMKFAEIANAFRDYEQVKAAKEGKQVKIHAWIVTNTDSVYGDAAKAAKENKLEIKKAVIPKPNKLISNVKWVISDLRHLT